MVKSVSSNQKSYRQNHGFTLIELLVVVAIIAVLVAVLIPALNLARAQAQTSVCASQLHQLGLGVIYYAKECNGIVPFCDGASVEEWRKYSPYMADFQKYSGLERKMFYCPTSPRTKRIDYYWEGTWQLYIGYSYIGNRSGYSGWWPNDEKPIINLDKDYDGWQPSQRLLFVDMVMTDGFNNLAGGEQSHMFGALPRGSNHLYGDGHVQWWKFRMEYHPVWGMAWVPIYHQLWNP
jgi:prepilin-type N-terminal cleavage/methylation domain-containing protein